MFGPSLQLHPNFYHAISDGSDEPRICTGSSELSLIAPSLVNKVQDITNNKPNDLSGQRRDRPAWKSTHSDQILPSLSATKWVLHAHIDCSIQVCRCSVWCESLLGALAQMYYCASTEAEQAVRSRSCGANLKDRLLVSGFKS